MEPVDTPLLDIEEPTIAKKVKPKVSMRNLGEFARKEFLAASFLIG